MNIFSAGEPISFSCFRYFSELFLIISTFSFAATVHAATISGTTAYYPTTGASGPAKSVASIPVRASVSNRCGFAAEGMPPSAVAIGALDAQAWQGRVPFISACNGPWRVAVSSEHGAMQGPSVGAVDGFAASAPYTVAIHVMQDAGDAVWRSCTADQIKATNASGACDFGGVASGENGLLIGRSFGMPGSYLEISAPAYAGPGRLVAGTYRDTLTITVSPAT